jgi:dipeptidyl aminopeptidase/acylaminoacyl peptidase
LGRMDHPNGMQLFTAEEIRQMAWVGDRFVAGKPRAVIVSFHGLRMNQMKAGPLFEEAEWGAAGGLVVFPYYGPWSWMNRSSRRFVNRLIPSVYEAFGLSREAPLLITGASMGGQGALLYTRYSPYPITACAAFFPVCDVPFHFTERPDLPATYRYAFRDDGDDLDALLEEHSPLHQVEQMPDIPYLIIHGDADQAVRKDRHSDPFVAQMRRLGRKIDYLEIPGMGHGTNIPYEAYRRYTDFIKGYIGAKN